MLAVFVSIIFLAVVFWGFPDSPSPWFDQGINLSIVKTFARDGVYSLGVGPNDFIGQRSLVFSTNYPLFSFIILSFKLFGVGLWQAQIVMVLFMAVFLWLAYLLSNVFLKNKILSLLAVALVITFLPFYGNGLSGGLGEVPGLVYFISGLLLSRKDKPWLIFLSGVFFGLGAATKVFNTLLLPCLLAGELWYAWQAKKYLWKRWFLIFGGFALPLLIWLFLLFPPGTIMENFRATYSYYKNPYSLNDSFQIFRNALKFLTETTPIHFLILIIAFVGGLLLKKKNPELKRMEIIIAAYVLFNIFWFVRSPGWYRYFFPAHLIVLALFPGALAGWFGDKIRQSIIIGALTLLLFTQAAYLIKERNSGLYYNPGPRMFAEFVNNNVSKEKDILVINNPAVAFLLESDRVWQRLAINPYFIGGRDWFSESQYPDFIVLNNDSPILLHNQEENLNKKYKKIYQVDRARLWQKL